MISRIKTVLQAGWLITVILFIAPSVSNAQSNLNLVTTDDPHSYVEGVLQDIEVEGMSSVREAFEQMGLNTPQSEAAIRVYEAAENEVEKRWTELIGTVESGSSLRQYYGYAFLGGNGWIYIRIDFNRKSETEWVLVNFFFDADYASVIAPNFGFLD